MPPKAKVAVLRTTPRTVVRDYHELLNLADYQQTLAKDLDTALKINISWHHFYPAASTTPWQLDGVVRAMQTDGFDPALIHACHNRTVVIDAHLGERENKQLAVVERHGLRNIHLYEGEQWCDVREAIGDLADDFLVLGQVYPGGFTIPRRLIGENIIHLPTVKTHVFTTTTGAMKNAFGGLLNEKRHWTHSVIHETLVDLLRIQQAIHPGVFAVMDGTFAGDGPGPRCMTPHVKGVILASADQVAIDAVAARLMGFDPLEIGYIRLAHEMGLGCGDVGAIEIAGDRTVSQERWHFEGPLTRLTFAARMQHQIYWGRLKPLLEWSLKTWMAPAAYVASVLYHDFYWYPRHGNQAVLQALQSDWGRLFANWEQLEPDELGFATLGAAPGEPRHTTGDLLSMAARVLGTSLREAPELAARLRRGRIGCEGMVPASAMYDKKTKRAKRNEET